MKFKLKKTEKEDPKGLKLLGLYEAVPIPYRGPGVKNIFYFISTKEHLGIPPDNLMAIEEYHSEKSFPTWYRYEKSSARNGLGGWVLIGSTEYKNKKL